MTPARTWLLAALLAFAPILGATQSLGDPAVLAAEGDRYHTGDGVLQNFATAADYYRQAAEAGVAHAQNRLGRYHHGGLGVARNQAQALHWLAAAADQGDAQHIFDLGAALEDGADGSSDPAAAAKAYIQAAELGHADAMVSLGVLYQDGRGVAQDFTQARHLYQGPADAGHARAQNNLGLLYVRGHGVPQDYERAVAFFTTAAEQGLTLAMTNLGVMYENGFGVPQDDDRATALYRQAGQAGAQSAATGYVYDARLHPSAAEDLALRQAAQAGDPLAQFQLAWLLVTAPAPDFSDYALAARLFTAAAQTGYPPAMANLGVMYFEGRGLPQDYVLGQMWITLASSAGLPEGALLTARLAPRLTPGQINEAQSMAAKYNRKMYFFIENQ